MCLRDSLGAEVVAIISPASGVLTLLSDDLSLVIFGQSKPSCVFLGPWLEVKKKPKTLIYLVICRA